LARQRVIVCEARQTSAARHNQVTTTTAIVTVRLIAPSPQHFDLLDQSDGSDVLFRTILTFFGTL
jgi:hypothetical protein